MLAQMESDLQMLDQKISACEEQIQEHTRRYEKLCGQIPDDVSHLADFGSVEKGGLTFTDSGLLTISASGPAE